MLLGFQSQYIQPDIISAESYWLLGMPTHILCGGIDIATGILGLTVNILVVKVFIFRVYNGKSQFDRLCLSRATANIICSSIFTFFVGPLILGWIPDNLIWLQAVFGEISVSLYGVILCTQAVSAIFRFIAVFAPFYYDRLINLTTVKIAIALIWIFSFSFSLPSAYPKCYFNYDLYLMSWLIISGETCSKLRYHVLNSTVYGSTATCFILNLCTFFRLCAGIANLRQETTSGRLKRNLRFVIQTLIQDSFYLFETLSFNFLPFDKSAASIYWFLAQNWVWQMCLLLDGLIMLGFNWRPKLGKKKETGSWKGLSRSREQHR